MKQAAVRKPNILKRKLPLIVAFLAPVIILLVIYAARGIYPFGDQMYLRSDMYHQYAPFLKLFQHIIKHGGSLSYSWNIGLGSNFLSTYAYYLASPLNWLVGILPSNHIPEIMSGFILLKSGLMSVAMTCYLRHRFQRRDLMAACFGIFYAMSGYMAAYSWNVMWLDCLILLPLMMLGLERLVKGRGCLLYAVCFALAVLSNYYIAIMLCLFSVLYFIYLMAAESVARGGKDVFRRIGRYLLYSLIGGSMGAVIFLPALMALFGTASADSSFPSTLKAYFNILEMFAHGMMNTEITMIEGYVPNIYCGIAVFALVPLYWLNRSVPLRQRAGKTILMGVMIFSFAFNIPAFIWHGFHFPNSLPSRQSFLYIFLVLLIGYEALLKIRKVSLREIFLCFGVALAAFFSLQALYDSEEYPISIAYISAGFLLVYGVAALLLHQKKKAVRLAAVAVLVIACGAEVTINTEATGYGTTSRADYTDDNEAIEYVLSSIQDEDFYRVEKLRRRSKNDAAWSGYRSASVFSSVTKAALSDFYEAFGMQSGTNSFSYYGNTPFTSALLGIRYKMTDVAEDDDPQLEYVTGKDSIFLYRSRYCLPLGFMVNETTQAEVNLMAQNPFVVQNDFVDAAKGAASVFAIEDDLEGAEISYTAKENGRLYFYIGQKLKNLTITRVNGEVPGGSNTFTSLECAMIVDAGEVRSGDELRLTTSDEGVTDFVVTPAMLDQHALEDALQALGEEPYEVASFGDTYVKGTVNAAKDGMLFTTIPYEKGWSVYVDGNKTEPQDFYGAFLQVPLEEGTHTVEFRYQVPGKTAGLILSLASFAALIFLTILKSRQKWREKSNGTECRLTHNAEVL